MNINFNKLKTGSLTDIPPEWIYKFYLNLPFDLTGRTVKVKSPFTNEKTPSMFIYLRNGVYVWKDHSGGESGDSLDLARKIMELSSGEAVSWKTTLNTVRADYEKWKIGGGFIEKIEHDPELFAYDLVNYVKSRPFESHDSKYWARFGIGEDLLLKYNVIALEWYQLGKFFSSNGTTKWYPKVKEYHSYGFYGNDGGIIKIYNPYSLDLKHVSLKRAVLGIEQLENKKTLVIAASMKDLLSIKSLDLDLDVIAPMGERTLIEAHVINDLKDLYTNILTLFDNDKTGISSMLMYKAVYNIDFAYLPYCKDVSEFRETVDTLTAKQEITKIINKKIFKGIESC